MQLAETAGVEALPWESWFCELSLRQQVEPDGITWRWAAMEVLLLVSRQNGKGTCLEIVELYCAFSLGLNVYHTAHLMETSRKHFVRLWALIERTPKLQRRVREVVKTAEHIRIVLTSGVFIEFMARSGRRGRGFDDADVVVLDEALFLEARMIEAVIPAMSTRPHPLVVYASSAGVATSVLLRALRKRLLDADPTIIGADWSVDPEAVKAKDFDPLAAEVVAQANPSLGALITMDYVRGEFAAMTSTGSLAGYLRERLGVFDEDPAAAKTAISKAAWDRRVGARGAPTERIGLAVAAAWPDGDVVSIGLAGRLDGELVVQLVDRRDGDDWVEGRLTGLALRLPGVPVAVDPGGPAGRLVESLRDAGLNVVTPTAREVAHSSQALKTEVDGPAAGLRRFVAEDQDDPELARLQRELDAAATSAGRRFLEGGWTWQRRGDVDVAPIEAVSLAAWVGETHAPAAVPPPVGVPADREGTRSETADLAHIGF